MRQKRLTPYLVDHVLVGATVLVSRQPAVPVYLEVEIDGNTVNSNGLVTVAEQTVIGVASYILQDRILGSNYEIQITNGIINISSTASANQNEPIIEDSLVTGQYWRIFISNGNLGMESIGIVENDDVSLTDTVTGINYSLIISAGNFGIDLGISSSETFSFSRNSVDRGSQEFIYISTITVSGISAGFISLKAINDMGQPVNQLGVVDSSMHCRFYTQQGRVKMQKVGQVETGDWKMMCEPNADIEENDVVEIISGAAGITAGRIVWKEAIFDFAGLTHHIEAYLASY